MNSDIKKSLEISVEIFIYKENILATTTPRADTTTVAQVCSSRADCEEIDPVNCANKGCNCREEKCEPRETCNTQLNGQNFH